MDTRLLISVVAIGVASATTGVGLFAFFSATAESVDNIFSAGNLVLEAGGAASLPGFIQGTNVKPGDTFSSSLALTNSGSLTGSDFDLDINLDIAQTDANFSKFWEITSLSYDGVAVVLSDGNGNGWVDLADLDANNTLLQDRADPGAAGKTLAMSLLFRNEAGNDLQGDNMDLTFTFFLAQVGEVDLGPNVI